MPCFSICHLSKFQFIFEFATLFVQYCILFLMDNTVHNGHNFVYPRDESRNVKLNATPILHIGMLIHHTRDIWIGWNVIDGLVTRNLPKNV